MYIFSHMYILNENKLYLGPCIIYKFYSIFPFFSVFFVETKDRSISFVCKRSVAAQIDCFLFIPLGHLLV